MSEVYNNFKFDLGPLAKSDNSPFDEENTIDTSLFAQFWNSVIKNPEFAFDKLEFTFVLEDTDETDEDMFDYIEVTVNVPFAEDDAKVKEFLEIIMKEFSIDAAAIFMQKIK